MKATLLKLGAGIIIACVFIAMIEATSCNPYFQLEEAVVRKVVDDPPWGFIGHDKRTIVRFHDGYNTAVAGDIGEPGETVVAPRQRGVITAFGILGDHRYFFAR